ncbi:glutamate--tRNA ligase [Selenomonas sp. oral taxon 137 str. F0430]|uniref:glutamate--tRNA ligase n=1 Tax=Selenomonas sp. oral taxon 137 TaxID=712531 RepID=UPI0001EB24A3|nr:glutamate--tRNA ligase [Selenomonas sp. oral taxon 137]EFR41610.1 glutamate--tRNA ligase [Selenomonas sp. oral taxon 137 str. F0430]
MNTAIRTRFAPSPTGYMHIGNLRTALYAYLFARANDGTFILRIEDTDRSRYVADAVDFIRRTLDAAGIVPDEGPDDIGGDYGPYVQSERMEIYKKYAEQLVATGHAYRCFCSHTEEVPPAEGEKSFGGYPRTCRDLSPEEIEARLARGEAYVIRQKMPLTGETTFYDVLHGNVTIPNTELEDQVLLKSDGMPTYNFANVIDDRLMKVSHIIRGTEFITSTPKHVLLYEAFGWEPPVFVHLAPVMGRDEETGKTSKLSKRHGATSFNDLVEAGYPAAAIVNYVALLGWSPKTTNQEVFSMDELIECFSLEGLSKSPAVFDYDKLGWMSGEYFKAMTDEEFAEAARPFAGNLPANLAARWMQIAKLLKTRVTKLGDVRPAIAFLIEAPAFDAGLYENKRNKVTPAAAAELLPMLIEILAALPAEHWENDLLYALLEECIEREGWRKGTVMWVLRIAAAGQAVTPGGATEILSILGRETGLARLHGALDRLNELH